MATGLTAWQKIQLLRGPGELSHSDVCEIAEIVFRECNEIWAVGDVLDSALQKASDADGDIAIPKWVVEGAFMGIASLLETELGQSTGKGKWAKVKTRREKDRVHLIRTIKVMKLLDKGVTLENACAEVAEATEGTLHQVKEDAVKASVHIVQKNLEANDVRYYLPLSPVLREKFGPLGDFDSYADWPVPS